MPRVNPTGFPTRKRKRRNLKAVKGDPLVQQVAQVRRASASHNVSELVLFSTEPGGFVNIETRRLAWRVLLCLDSADYVEPAHELEESEINQVRLDVNRSFSSYPKDLQPKRRKELQKSLERLIIHTLRSCPQFHYYQGFHDIATVLLLVLGEKHAKIALNQLSIFWLRDYLGPNLEPAISHLGLLYPIISTRDRALGDRMQDAGLQPFFAISWLLTHFSHDVGSLDHAARILDYTIANGPVALLFLCAAVVLVGMKTNSSSSNEGNEFDPSLLHSSLRNFPCEWYDTTLQQAIDLAEKMRAKAKIEKFQQWQAINPGSVLHSFDSEFAVPRAKGVPPRRGILHRPGGFGRSIVYWLGAERSAWILGTVAAAATAATAALVANSLARS